MDKSGIWMLEKPPFEVQVKACELSLLGKDPTGRNHYMEQGLGKTGVLLNEITYLHWQDEIAGAVVWAPMKVVLNWPDEAAEMGFKGVVYAWPKVPRISEFPKDRPWVIVVNIEALITTKFQNLLEEVLETFGKKVKLASDESSKMKNPTSKRTKQYLHYGARVHYTRNMSGTPAPQSAADYWSQLKFANAIRLRFFPFRNRFCRMGGYMGKQITGLNPDNEEELQGILSSCSFFAEKKDWTDLPEKRYMPAYRVPLAPVQSRMYREIQEDFFTVVKSSEVTSTMAITTLGKLAQICSGFVKDDEGKEICLFDKFTDIPKFKAMVDMLEENSKKNIIFTMYKFSTENIFRQLQEMGRNPAVIRGGMTGEESNDEKKKFNNDPTCRDIVVQIQSGGIGLTLLGQTGKDRCSNTFYYENSYSLEDRKQSEDRNHRHGQDEMVTYHDFVCGPCDEKLIKALQRKDDIRKAVTDPILWMPTRMAA